MSLAAEYSSSRATLPESCMPISTNTSTFSMNTITFHIERARMRMRAETMTGECRPRTSPAATTLAAGAALKFLIPDIPWAAAFAFGAIVSPPDAVAATAVLSRMKIPRRVVTVLEGESLVNDAAGLVLYKFAVAAVLTGAV